MKTVVDALRNHGVVLPKLEPVDLKAVGIKRRLEMYAAVDEKQWHTLILRVQRASRILQKDAQGYDATVKALSEARGHNFGKKLLLLDAPICSKAKTLLQQSGWKVLT